MAIVVRCSCSNEWKAGDAARGRSMPCPRCQATVVIGGAVAEQAVARPPSVAPPTENLRLKMALVLVAGGHPFARREVFDSLRAGSLLVPLRRPTSSPSPADCFYRPGRGMQALLAFTDRAELRPWPSAAGASIVHLGMPALVDLMSASGPRTGLLVNEVSLLGLVLDVAHVRDLARGKDPEIPDLRQYVTAGPATPAVQR